MSFLNLNYGLMMYEDASTRQPSIRLTDIAKTVDQVAIDNEESAVKHLAPGETLDIATTLRAVVWDATTELTIARYLVNQDFIRISHTGTGTAPNFRTKRAIAGDATTVVTVTRVSPYVARITNTAGTVWSLGSVVVGDIIKMEKDTDVFASPFSDINQGKHFTVQAKGADYIDFFDNGEAALDTAVTLGADFEFALRVFSAGPVKIGDTVAVSGDDINPANEGTFEIVDLSYDYVEFVNPYSIEQTFTKATNVLNVYDYLIGFIHLRSSGVIKIRTDEESSWMTINKLQTEALFMGSVQAYRVTALNDSTETVSVSIQHARVNG